MSVFSPYAAQLSTIPVREEVVTILGSETHYWVYGEDDAPVTFMLTHGYRGEHHGLEPVIAQLEGVRFISPDLPGFGESSELTEVPHSIDGYAQWLREFQKTLGIESAVLVGHSFGSIISSYAIGNGLVDPPKLVLINPIAASALEGPSRHLTKLTMGFYRSSLVLPEKAGYWLLSNWAIIQGMSSKLTRTKDKVLRKWIHDQHHTYFGRFASRQSVVDSFDASVSCTVADFAESITMPTILIAAEKDPINSVDQVLALQAKLPNSTLHMIPDVGHLIHYETPRIAAQFIIDFVGAGVLTPEPA